MSARPSGTVTIDIEGVIGIPEEWQFEGADAAGQRVATFRRFRESVEEIAAIDAAKVRVNIRSIGGNVNDALLIYEALCSLGAEVETRCYGYVASAATVIAQAASRGKRYVSSGSLYLIHNSTTLVDGNSTDVRRTARLLSKTDDRIAEVYALRSGRPVEDFVELMGRDGGHGEWLSPEEVIEAGLADAVEQVSPLRNAGRKMAELARAISASASDRFQRFSAWAATNDFEDPVAARVDALEKRVADIEASEQDAGSISKRLRGLEQENARLRARPTATLPKEDPAVGPRTPRPNETAYVQDAEMFR